VINSVAFASNGDTVTGDSEGNVIVWASGEIAKVVKAHTVGILVYLFVTLFFFFLTVS
jgi:hypothetical protein